MPSTKRKAILKSPDYRTSTDLNASDDIEHNGSQIERQIRNGTSQNPRRSTSQAGTMNKAQLADFVSNASEKGFNPSKLAKLCYRIDALEKKYGWTYEELIAKLEDAGKTLDAKSKELKKVDAEISSANKKKNDLMEQYLLDEKLVQDYADARDALSSIGFDIDKLPNVKNILLTIRKEDYDLKNILGKLNSIGDLESRKNTLQNDLNALTGEMRAKKILLIEIKKLQDTGLNIDQVERIRDVIGRISSSHGINADQAFERFEQDVLKHYNATLGLETEIAMLQESKESYDRENELRRKNLDQAEKELVAKTKRFEESYAKQKEELKAYSELRASGVDGSTIKAWQEMIRSGKVDPELFGSEIQRVGNLTSLEEQTKSRIKELEEKQKALESALVELNQKKELIELSIGTVKDSSIGKIEETSSKALSSISEISKQLGQVTESAKQQLETTLNQLKSSATLFSDELKDSLKDVGPQMKNVAQAVEAARAIGKYEAILPLFKLTDSSQSNNITETEALVALWNVANAFNSWIKKHYPDEELEIAEPLQKMIEALDGEIQGLGKGSKEEESDGSEVSEESEE